MQKVVILVCAAVIGFACHGESIAQFPAMGQCGPSCGYVTKMAPCVKTEMAPCVQPAATVVQVPKVTYRCQKVLVRATPVGRPCGEGPCVQCCPQPFCHVEMRNVPCLTYECQTVPSYNVVYKPVCRQVWLPQTYKVEQIPLCY